MKRTVMFEATSETTFKEDPDQFAVRVREFNILDLEGRDESDLQIVEMRIFLGSETYSGPFCKSVYRVWLFRRLVGEM